MSDRFITSMRNMRLRLGQAPRQFDRATRKYLKLTRPVWCVFGRDDLAVVYQDQMTLFEHGQVVWGSLIQANQLLFEAGGDDCPGVAIYSPDLHWGADYRPLAAMAEKLSNLKEGETTTGPEKGYGAMLRDEMARGMGVPVPPSIAGKANVLSTSVMFARKHLPGGILKAGYFPLVTDTRTKCVMLLPERYWDQDLLELWHS